MLHSTTIYIIIIHLFHTSVMQQKKDDPKAALSLMPEIHIVVRAPDPKHNTLTKALFRKRCALPSSTNYCTVYGGVNVLVSDAHEVIALVICAIRPQMPIRLRYSESVLIRGNQNQSTSISNKKAALTISTASLNTL